MSFVNICLKWRFLLCSILEVLQQSNSLWYIHKAVWGVLPLPPPHIFIIFWRRCHEQWKCPQSGIAVAIAFVVTEIYVGVSFFHQIPSTFCEHMFLSHACCLYDTNRSASSFRISIAAFKMSNAAFFLVTLLALFIVSTPDCTDLPYMQIDGSMAHLTAVYCTSSGTFGQVMHMCWMYFIIVFVFVELQLLHRLAFT